MAKVTPVLWTQKKNKKGLCPIYLRIEANDKRRYVSLRTYIKETQWNDNKQRVRKNHQHADEINHLITQRIAEAQAEVLRLKTEREAVTTTALKETIALEKPDEKEAQDFLAFADEVIDQFNRRGQLYTARRYKSILKKFRAFTGEPLPFAELTPTLLRRFQTYLVEKRGNAPSTVASALRCIRAILYRAIKEGLFSQADNPFFHVKVRKPKTTRTKLSGSDIQAIESLELEKGSLIWHVRNYFLFSFYCAGIRFGDVAKMRCENIIEDEGVLRLSYQMSKTGTSKTIKLMPQAVKIVDHYRSKRCRKPKALLFPILKPKDFSSGDQLLNAISNRNTVVNKYLKKVAKQAGVTKTVSFHVARHSFADVARQRGWDVYLISKALGHSSLKVTENYLSGFDTQALDAEMDQLFGQD